MADSIPIESRGSGAEARGSEAGGDSARAPAPPPPAHKGSLDPAILDQLSGLSLVARTVVEGFMTGQHRSPFRGSSSEFAQYREYVPGDELRRIDWRVWARSDRLVIKEFVEETTLNCHLLVDASESMAYGSLGYTKFDYARWCAAALAHLVLSARDTAGLVLFDEHERTRVAPKNGDVQKRGILEALENAKPVGPTSIGQVLFWLNGRLSRKGIIVILSDFFDDLDKIVEGVRRLRHVGHEPILVQILDPLELSFDISTLTRFEGLENAGRLKIDPKAIREAYRKEIEAHCDGLARQARSLSVDYLRVTTDMDLGAVLSTYLARRTARVRGGGR